MPDDAPAMGVAAGARHQARGGPLLAVAGHRPLMDPHRIQGARPRHRHRHGGLYQEIYTVDGVHHIDFPRHYPVSRVLGCVDVVGCVRSEELVCWEDVPQSVRLEGLTDFFWLCENPQKLVVPFEMRGYQGVYNLERRVYEGAARGLLPVQGPLPVKFPLPDPRNSLSLKPGSLNFDS
ncbi:hypothetical protein D1007_28733 [Hordeum vulgare]|nr:hypothetical protein D1007_28733 [Hordeum vulgare]